MIFNLLIIYLESIRYNRIIKIDTKILIKDSENKGISIIAAFLDWFSIYLESIYYLLDIIELLKYELTFLSNNQR